MIAFIEFYICLLRCISTPQNSYFSTCLMHLMANIQFIMQDAYAKFVKETYSDSVQSYDQKHLKNTAVSEDNSDRLWWFQVCTEVAYFQVAPSNDSVRSSKVDTR